MPSQITMQMGQILALIAAVASGATQLSTIESEAKDAKASAEQMRQEVKDLRKDLQRHRELLARVDGDTRAILQILRMRGQE
ncbi:MAG: hypothetical protein CL678_02265 [Bdellovibrionaceae bacterium]|nr:hypothetical protein [Pseudobdellovibrionaceae bacterium]